MAVTGARPASHPPRPTATRRLRVAIGAAGLAASVALGAIVLPPVARAAGEADPLLHVLQALAEDAGTALIVGDAGAVAESDPNGDVGTGRRYDDIVSASLASLPSVPPWLLDAFDCAAANVACAPEGSLDGRFSGGAIVVGERLAGPPALLPAGDRGEWGPILALDQYPTAPLVPDDPFAGASQAFVTRIDGERRQLDAFAFVDDAFTRVRTDARSMWVGDDLLTLIPVDEELLTPPVAWDVYASSGDGSTTGRDTVRGLEGVPLLALTGPLPEVTFEEAVASAEATPSESVAASASTSPTTPASAPPSVAPFPTESAPAASVPNPASSPSGQPISAIAGLWDDLLFRLLLGLILALVGLALLARRTGPRPPPGTPPPTPPPTSPTAPPD